MSNLLQLALAAPPPDFAYTLPTYCKRPTYRTIQFIIRSTVAPQTFGIGIVSNLFSGTVLITVKWHLA